MKKNVMLTENLLQGMRVRYGQSLGLVQPGQELASHSLVIFLAP